MPAQRSPYFNDPNIGAGFSNIASIFAPPDAGDAANYALARGRNQTSDLIQKLAADPSNAGFDHQGVLAGLFNPSQSFGMTTRGQDVQANTSMSNNAADNARTLQTNAADNARMLTTNSADNTQKFATGLYGPLSEGQVRPAVPQNIADLFGMPTVDAAAGNAKPLTEAEVKGGILQNQTLTPEETKALVMGTTPVENIVGPDGNPQVQYRTSAVGQQPAPPAQTNGLSVTTNPDGTTTVTQGGSKPFTEAQSKDLYYYNNGAGALPILDKFSTALTSLPEAVGGKVPVLGNYVKSEDYQLAEQAGRSFLNALLRKESGAAIRDEEQASYGSTYLPAPGDKPALLAQKKAARERALQGIKLGLPPAAILALEQAGVDVNIGNHAAAAPGATPDTSAPQHGDVVDGFQFNGGDPGVETSWSKVM